MSIERRGRRDQGRRQEVRRRALAKMACIEDPLRLELVDRLRRSAATAKQLADEFALPVERVRYHLQRLSRAGLVRVLPRRTSRGRPENVYGADGRSFVVDEEELAAVPLSRRRTSDIRWLKRVLQDATASVREGAYYRQPEHALIRLPMRLDASGWKEAVEVQSEAAAAILATEQASSGRLAAQGGEGIDACAVLAHFELVGGAPFPDPGGGSLPDGEATVYSCAARTEEKLTAPRDRLRLEIIDFLTLKPATAAELAEGLGTPIDRVRYRLTRLTEAGLVGVRSQRQRRGTIERTYSIDSRRLVVRREETDRLGSSLKQKEYRRLLSIVFREMLGAIESEHFSRRTDLSNVRIPLVVDSQGWAEIADVLEVATNRLLDVKESSLRRLREQSLDAVNASSVLLLFEQATPALDRGPREASASQCSN